MGCQSLLEVVRWRRSIELKTDDFKVNNSFEPYLARLIAKEHPDLHQVFEFRRAPSADAWLAARRVRERRAMEGAEFGDGGLFAAMPAPRDGGCAYPRGM